jgi:phage shock protein PspC (stress-responsive transcriptional regulator)
MQKVISINLNGHAYQLDESGYDALREYLESAERALATNPDRAEIMGDLEQAIAEKCQRFLGPHKSVVSASEIDLVVKEMGPIETPSASDTNGPNAQAADGKDASHTEPRPRRLYRNPDGAMIAGVCSGLATYFGIDVAFVRIGFVLVALLSKGAGILIYVAMMFIVPEARTGEERAAAGGMPFNAQEVIDRAKKQYAEGARHWRRQWRQQQRQWRRYGWATGRAAGFEPPPWTVAITPLFAFVHLALFLTMASMMISLVNTGQILNWRPPENVPVWAGALMLLVGYHIVVSPIRAMQHWSWNLPGPGQPGLYAFWNAAIWLTGMAAIVWIASHHIPEIQEFIRRLPELVRQFAEAIRGLVSEPK